jgi:glycosyltransferase involved in cell wall biosynthesis
MQICIDIQPAVTQRAGVGRYTRLLVEHLDALAEKDELRLFSFDFKGQGAPIPTQHAVQNSLRWCPGRLAQGLWKNLNWPPFEFFAGRADVYHFPNFLIPPLRQGKSVVTIHDMSFVRHPEFAEERNRRHLNSRIADTAARADTIITDSQFSADEILELLDVSEDRVVPIHLGISTSFQPRSQDEVQSMRSAYGIDRPYLLTVGTIEPRKNVAFMIEAFERMQHFDGILVLAGMLGWKFEPILKRIEDSPRAADILILEYVDDASLPALYTGAELLLLTSHYEGFGFPPLEAMACGTPVLSSRGGSLPEVIGDAAACLDTKDPDLWAHEATSLLADSKRLATQITRGEAHAKRFSWRQTALETWNVYSKLAGAT